MCTKEHWKLCNDSTAYHAARKFALLLEEYAKDIGHKHKKIRIRNKEQIIKGGYGKSDAQVIWEDGPEGWAYEFSLGYNSSEATCIAHDDYTVSFYVK